MYVNRSGKGITYLTLLSFIVGMGCSPYILKDNGFRGIELGDDFGSVQSLKWKDGPKRDTLFSEGGYEWRGILLEAEHGTVLVEEGFFGEHKINRIRVESDKFRTKFDIKVGDPVSRLQQMSVEWILIPLPEYGKVDIYSESHPSFHFLVPWEAESPEGEITLTDIDGSQPVVGIVIM